MLGGAQSHRPSPVEEPPSPPPSRWSLLVQVPLGLFSHAGDGYAAASALSMFASDALTPGHLARSTKDSDKQSSAHGHVRAARDDHAATMKIDTEGFRMHRIAALITSYGR